MIIDCISDLHGAYPELEGGDLLIVAGDLTARDTLAEHADLKLWLYRQSYRKIVVIAGNHDGHFVGIPPDKYVFSSYNANTGEQKSYADYLCDSGIEFDGLKIWGSPWTPEFYNWHFMLPRGPKIAEKWALIPNDTDILITHGPPHGILDKPHPKKDNCGCADLRNAVERIKPKLHVFGHIHGGYGIHTSPHGFDDSMDPDKETIFANCAHMNEDYEPVNKPIRVVL